MEQSTAARSGVRRAAFRGWVEPLGFLAAFGLLFGLIGHVMGPANMINTMMNTAYRLLIDTVFYLLAITVLTGAISGLLSEFGVVDLFNRLLSPLMRPVFGLPGASALGLVTTYLSDNPAILTLADNGSFRSCFRKYQIPALTNLGTAFGMGLVVSTFMLALGKGMGPAVAAGNLGAVVGAIVSTRLMLCATAKALGKEDWCEGREDTGAETRTKRSGGLRFLDAIMAGGKSGVEMGLSIIPGVLIICTLVFLLTGTAGPEGVYTGAAFEGVGVLPWLGQKLSFVLCPLFGFTSPEAVAVPITALGSAGAAIGLVPQLLRQGMISPGDIAVFTAMCMCWSGYLSTHVAMMSSLGCPQFSGKAILSHTVGGIAAGVAAHLIYQLLVLL